MTNIAFCCKFFLGFVLISLCTARPEPLPSETAFCDFLSTVVEKPTIPDIPPQTPRNKRETEEINIVEEAFNICRGISSAESKVDDGNLLLRQLLCQEMLNVAVQKCKGDGSWFPKEIPGQHRPQCEDYKKLLKDIPKENFLDVDLPLNIDKPKAPSIVYTHIRQNEPDMYSVTPCRPLCSSGLDMEKVCEVTVMLYITPFQAQDEPHNYSPTDVIPNNLPTSAVQPSKPAQDNSTEPLDNTVTSQNPSGVPAAVAKLPTLQPVQTKTKVEAGMQAQNIETSEASVHKNTLDVEPEHDTKQTKRPAKPVLDTNKQSIPPKPEGNPAVSENVNQTVKANLNSSQQNVNIAAGNVTSNHSLQQKSMVSPAPEIKVKGETVPSDAREPDSKVKQGDPETDKKKGEILRTDKAAGDPVAIPDNPRIDDNKETGVEEVVTEGKGQVLGKDDHAETKPEDTVAQPDVPVEKNKAVDGNELKIDTTVPVPATPVKPLFTGDEPPPNEDTVDTDNDENPMGKNKEAGKDEADENGDGIPSQDAATDQVTNKQKIGTQQQFPEQQDSHFFAYFLTVIIIIILCYLVVHNKQKILGLIVEGRGSQRRRSHSYRKLDTEGSKGSGLIF